VAHNAGYRVLRGAEWELFRVGLSTLWDEIESQLDDEEPGLTDVKAFDRLSRPERLALLAQVGRGLHDRREPCPDLTALNEAAVAAVFAQVVTWSRSRSTRSVRASVRFPETVQGARENWFSQTHVWSPWNGGQIYPKRGAPTYPSGTI
jgi:hypothetical protein